MTQLKRSTTSGRAGFTLLGLIAGLACMSVQCPAAAVVAWGNNGWGQAEVPPGLTNVIAVAAGTKHSLALKADGTLVGWGSDEMG